MPRSPAITLLGFVLVACTADRREPSLPTEPEGLVAGAVIHLAFTPARPRAGDRVTVTGRLLRGPDAGPVGSFTAHLAYDTTALAFIGAESFDAGIGAMQPAAGRINIAGASPEGFGGQLFAATFQVRDAAGLASLTLAVSELRGADFSDMLPKLNRHVDVSGRARTGPAPLTR